MKGGDGGVKELTGLFGVHSDGYFGSGKEEES